MLDTWIDTGEDLIVSFGDERLIDAYSNSKMEVSLCSYNSMGFIFVTKDTKTIFIPIRKINYIIEKN